MESKDSVPHSKEPVTGLFLEPDEPSPHLYISGRERVIG